MIKSVKVIPLRIYKKENGMVCRIIYNDVPIGYFRFRITNEILLNEYYVKLLGFVMPLEDIEFVDNIDYFEYWLKDELCSLEKGIKRAEDNRTIKKYKEQIEQIKKVRK